MKLKYSILLILLLLIAGSGCFASREKTIYGLITSSEDGYPLPAARIMVSSSTMGTKSDENGFYSLKIPENADTLVVSFLGFIVQTIDINSIDCHDNCQLNISMEPHYADCPEVYIVHDILTKESHSYFISGKDTLSFKLNR